MKRHDEGAEWLYELLRFSSREPVRYMHDDLDEELV
jgi:hypothetical protein